MKTTSFKTSIGGTEHLIGVLDFTATDRQTVMVGRTHHAWILDRSYSMSHDLHDLVAQVKTAATRIKSDDLLSVFYFSGPGQFSEVVVGATAGQDIQKLLDTMSTPIGSTCFSEVMGKVKDVVVRFNTLVDQAEITLFTDGQPVVPWGQREEENRAVAMVEQIKAEANLVAFNAIGYTPYYNRDFLNRMVNVTEHGRFVHTMDIDNFLETITANIEIAATLVGRKIELNTADADIVYVTNETAALRTGTFDVSSLSKDSNVFYVVFGPDAKNTKVQVLDAQDGEVDVDFAAKLDKTPDGLRDNFFYAYAAKLYGIGNRRKALDLVAKNAHDKALAELVISAYSPVETGDCQNALEAAVSDRSKRMVGGRTPPNFIPKPDAFCLMDLFRLFFANGSKVFYIPQSKNVDAYKRIGRKATDSQNAFKAGPDEVRAPVKEFVWNKDQLNLSVRFFIKGAVDLNAKAVERVNAGAAKPLANPFPSGIFRNHTFVKDGTPNINSAEFLIEKTLWADKFTDLPLKSKIIESDVEIDGDTYVRVVLDLQRLPIINRTYVEKADDTAELHSFVVEMTKLEAQRKVAKHLLDKVKESSATMLKTDTFSGLNADQITVLTDHGISDKGVYGGIDTKVASVAESDSYTARKMAFQLKGTASLPSITEFEAMLERANDPEGKKGKKANYGGQLMIDYYTQLLASIKAAGLDLDKPTVALRDFLQKEVSEITNNLAVARQHINLIKLAKILTNDFFVGLDQDEKGNHYIEKDDQTVVLKTEYITVAI